MLDNEAESPIPETFWFEESTVRALGALDIAGVLARIALLPGWNQGRLAQVLGYSRPTMNKILNRARPLQVGEVAEFASALSIPRYLVGFAEDASTHPKGGGDDLHWASIKGLTAKFSALERQHGGIALTRPLARRVRALEGRVRESHDMRVVAAFGELAALAGYTFYDSQAFRQADYYYSLALQAAHESGNAMLVGQVRALLSMKSTWLENGRQDSAHCYAVLESGLPIPPAVRAVLMGRQARAEALRGDGSKVDLLLDGSQDAMAQSPSVESAVAYWSDLEFYGNSGIAYKELGRYDLAEQNLVHAVAIANASDSRDQVLYLGMLCRLYVKQDRRDEALDLAQRCVSPTLSSARADRQLQLFLRKTTHWGGSAMAEFRPRIRAALADRS